MTCHKPQLHSAVAGGYASWWSVLTENLTSWLCVDAGDYAEIDPYGSACGTLRHAAGARHRGSQPSGRSHLPDLQPELQDHAHRPLCCLAAGAVPDAHAVGLPARPCGEPLFKCRLASSTTLIEMASDTQMYGRILVDVSNLPVTGSEGGDVGDA